MCCTPPCTIAAGSRRTMPNTDTTLPPISACGPSSTLPKTATASPSTLPSMVVLPKTATAASSAEPVTFVSPKMDTTVTASPALVEDPKIDTTDSACSPAAKVESCPMLTKLLFWWPSQARCLPHFVRLSRSNRLSDRLESPASTSSGESSVAPDTPGDAWCDGSAADAAPALSARPATPTAQTNRNAIISRCNDGVVMDGHL